MCYCDYYVELLKSVMINVIHLIMNFSTKDKTREARVGKLRNETNDVYDSFVCNNFPAHQVTPLYNKINNLLVNTHGFTLVVLNYVKSQFSYFLFILAILPMSRWREYDVLLNIMTSYPLEDNDVSPWRNHFQSLWFAVCHQRVQLLQEI